MRVEFARSAKAIWAIEVSVRNSTFPKSVPGRL